MVQRAADDASGSAGTTDPDAVEYRIRSYLDSEHRRVVATISLWTGSLDDATDAATDALGRAWERLARGSSIDNLAAWVTHAAMNQIRSAHRRSSVARRKRHLVVVSDTEDDPTASHGQYVDLRRAVRELTKRQRDVLALYYGLDLPVERVAEALDIAPGTVKATLHQSRTRLVSLLDLPDKGESP
jgi:RNA polymerase sigma-70 factor (ECF subfamily)